MKHRFVAEAVSAGVLPEPRENSVRTALDVESLDFLQAVYRNNSLPLSVRMRAAEAALPFERPKLAAVLSATMDDLGDKLERARLRAIGGLASPAGPMPEPRALSRPGLPK
jgi:HEAT repeat protein